MKNPTMNDLLMAFGLKKPNGEDSQSVPNVPKVEVLTHLTISALLNSNAGLGTMLGVGLKSLRGQIMLVLGAGSSTFEQNKEVVLQQIDVLRSQVEAASFQEVQAHLLKLQDEAKEFILEVQQKMAVTHPDVSASMVKDVEDQAEQAQKMSDTDKELSDELSKLMGFPSKKKDDKVH